MPTFISKRGVLHPAKENVSLVYKGTKPIPKEDLPKGITIAGDVLEPGQGFIYDGPDREALRMLHEAGEESLGKDFKNDPDFLQAVRNMGYQSPEEYLQQVGYDEKKDEEDFKKKATTVKSHEIPKRVEAIEVLAGGRDYSGEGADSVGGFGEQQVKPPKSKQ